MQAESDQTATNFLELQEENICEDQNIYVHTQRLDAGFQPVHFNFSFFAHSFHKIYLEFKTLAFLYVSSVHVININ